MPLPLPLELFLTAMKHVAHFVLQAGVNRASFVYLFSFVLEKSGYRRAAAWLYDRALAFADRSPSRKIFMVRQAWEFQAERNQSVLGSPRVLDPLFHVSIGPDHSRATKFPRRFAVGYYDVSVGHRGLRIDGYLRPGIKAREVKILINDMLIRQTSVSQVVPGLNLFVVYIQRDAISALPPACKIELMLDDGELLIFNGCEAASLLIPHASLATSATRLPVQIDKKGFLVRPVENTAQLQQRFLELYSAASRFFEVELGIPLFILYGTLLGQHRQGDFIPGDDDFDVGYYSDASHSAAVRSQGMDFVVRLVEAGFVVVLNRQGRLFRLRLPGMPPKCHLDVHAVWRERGSLWIHPRANLECGRDDFLPVARGKFRNVDVAIPARPEAFLSAYYGVDWRTPNSSYSTAARSFPGWKARLLNRSCVTPMLVERMKRRISECRHPTEGQLIVIGTQSIYPLDRYEALCDW
jgi:hypothetical protein